MRPVARALRGHAGFSLIEVLIASLIVGLAAVGVALMVATGQAFVHAEGDNRVMVFLAQQRVEQLRARGYAALEVTDITTAEPAATAAPELITDAGDQERYVRTWSVVGVHADNYTVRVACSEPLVCPGGKRIAVTVERSPADPKTGPVTLRAVVADR